MTASSSSTSSTQNHQFVQAYANLFSEGLADLDKMAFGFLTYINAFPSKCSKEKYEELLKYRITFQVAIEGKKSYYENGLEGKIANTFQDLMKPALGLFGHDTPLENAESILQKSDQLIKSCKRSVSDSETMLKAQVHMASSLAEITGETRLFHIGDEVEPGRCVVAYPNGNVQVVLNH